MGPRREGPDLAETEGRLGCGGWTGGGGGCPAGVTLCGDEGNVAELDAGWLLACDCPGCPCCVYLEIAHFRLAEFHRNRKSQTTLG